MAFPWGHAFQCILIYYKPNKIGWCAVCCAYVGWSEMGSLGADLDMIKCTIYI